MGVNHFPNNHRYSIQFNFNFFAILILICFLNLTNTPATPNLSCCSSNNCCWFNKI